MISRPAFQPNTAPLGHIEYARNASKLRPTRGRGRVAITLFWLTTAAAGFGAFVDYFRRETWRDFVDQQATVRDLDKADELLVAASIARASAWVLGGIVVAMWARRVAKNSIARGARNVSVGRATIGWFIPIGWWWIGFSSVRASVTQLGASGRRVGLWQGAFLFANVAAALASYRTRSFDVAESVDDVNNTLNRLLLTGVVSFATLVLAAIFATRAIIDTNRVVCDPPPGYLSQEGRPAS